MVACEARATSGAGSEGTRPGAKARSGAERRRCALQQKEFIQVTGIADFNPKAKTRAGELREKMKRASQEIAKDPRACA